MDARCYALVRDGSLGQPLEVLAHSDTRAFDRSNSLSIARSGDLLIAQLLLLLASVAPGSEHRASFPYNERYKLYERLDCNGHSFNFVTGA